MILRVFRYFRLCKQAVKIKKGRRMLVQVSSKFGDALGELYDFKLVFNMHTVKYLN